MSNCLCMHKGIETGTKWLIANQASYTSLVAIELYGTIWNISSTPHIPSACQTQGSCWTNCKIRAGVGLLCPLCIFSAQLIMTFIVFMTSWKFTMKNVALNGKTLCGVFPGKGLLQAVQSSFVFFCENWISHCLTSNHELNHISDSVESFMCKSMKETTSSCADHWNLQINITHIYLSLPYYEWPNSILTNC